MTKAVVRRGHPANALNPVCPFFGDKVLLGYRVHIFVGVVIELQPALLSIVKA